MFPKKEEVYLGKKLKQSASREIKHEISLVRSGTPYWDAVYYKEFTNQ